MMNMTAGGSSYSVSFIQRQRTFGKGTLRMVVECDLFSKENRYAPLYYVSKGIAICNPVDTFSPKIGMHKALTSATGWMDRAQRKELHAQLDTWF